MVDKIAGDSASTALRVRCRIGLNSTAVSTRDIVTHKLAGRSAVDGPIMSEE